MSNQNKKNFFVQPSVAKIKAKNTSFETSSLVKKILDLDPEFNSIIINSLIEENTKARTAYKYSSTIPLPNLTKLPRNINTINDILLYTYTKLQNSTTLKEDDIFFAGYSITPILGKDKTPKVFMCNSIAQGERLVIYSEKYASRFKSITAQNKAKIHILETYYPKEESILGATISVSVPSESKSPRYKILFPNVPMINGKNSSDLSFSFNPKFISATPPINTYEHIRFPGTNLDDTLYKQIDFHQIAGYMGLVNEVAKQNNLTPFLNAPFFTFSKDAMEFYQRLNNNVLVKDEKNKFRHLNRTEKSILLTRLIKTYSVKNTFRSKNEGPIKDYLPNQSIYKSS